MGPSAANAKPLQEPLYLTLLREYHNFFLPLPQYSPCSCFPSPFHLLTHSIEKVDRHLLVLHNRQ